MGKRTLIIIFATLLLFAVGGLGAYLVLIPGKQDQKSSPVQTTSIVSTQQKITTSTISGTSDWETYRYEEYGFEISFPKKGWEGMCKKRRNGGDFCIYMADLSQYPGNIGNRSLEDLLKDPEANFQLFETWRADKCIVEPEVEICDVRWHPGTPEEERGRMFMLRNKIVINRHGDPSVPVVVFHYFPGTATPEDIQEFEKIMSTFRVIQGD
jgi:hypothetical protein